MESSVPCAPEFSGLAPDPQPAICCIKVPCEESREHHGSGVSDVIGAGDDKQEILKSFP